MIIFVVFSISNIYNSADILDMEIRHILRLMCCRAYVVLYDKGIAQENSDVLGDQIARFNVLFSLPND